MTENKGLHSLWKDLIMAQFKVLTWNLHAVTDENHKTSVTADDDRAQIPIRPLPNTSQEHYHTRKLLLG